MTRRYVFAVLIGLIAAAAVHEWVMSSRKPRKPAPSVLSDEEVQVKLDRMYGRDEGK